METDPELNYTKIKALKGKTQTNNRADKKIRIKKKIQKNSKESVKASTNPHQHVETVELKTETINMSQKIPSPQPSIKPISTVLCIPAYNEEKEIGALIIKSKPYFDRILVCDDGSDDLMGQIATGLGATVIRHEASIGRIATIRTLLERSLELEPATTLVMDVNPRLQPSEIQNILSPIKSKEVDIVFGAQPTEGTNQSENADEDDLKNIFMALSQKSLKAFLSAPPEVLEKHSRILGVASGNGFNLREVPIELQRAPFTIDENETQTLEAPQINTEIKQQPPTQDKPNDQGIAQNFIKLISTKPFLFFGIPGLLSLAIGIYAGYYLITTFLNLNYLSLAAAFIMIIGVISGLILAITSIILASFSAFTKEG